MQQSFDRKKGAEKTETEEDIVTCESHCIQNPPPKTYRQVHLYQKHMN